MNEQELELVFLVVGGVVILACHLIYNRTPRLHTCAGCGKYLDVKAKRQFYSIDDKNHPVCLDCLQDPETNLMSYDNREKALILSKLEFLFTEEEMKLLNIKVKDGKLSVATKDKLLAERLASILAADVKTNSTSN